MAGVVLVGAFSARPALAATGINKTLNLQGRLLTNTGAIVADGNYNFRVRIYQDGDGVLGGGDETLKWTELWQNAVASGSSAPVVVKNGYFSINLGSFCVLAGGSCQGTTNTGVDFNQTVLWASLDIGGTSVGTSPTYDGEMTPFRRLSSAVYALQAENANTLGGLSSSGFIQNTTTVQSGANIYVRSAATGSVVSVLEGANGQTADLLDFNTFNGTTSTTVAKFTAAGNLQVAASIDTVTGTSLAVGGTNATSLVLGKNSGTTSTTVQSGSGGYSVTSTGNGSVTANGNITITAGGGSTWSTSAGNLIVQAGGTDELRLQTGGAGIVALGDQNSTTVRIGRGSNIARTIDIGTAGTSTTQTISIGSTGGASVLNLIAGSAGVKINDAANSPTLINAGTSTGTVTIGNTGNASNTVNIAAGSTGGINLQAPTTLNSRLLVNSTTSGNASINIIQTVASTSTGSHYGIQNDVLFNPAGASVNNIYGGSNIATVTGSNVAITQLVGLAAGIATQAGYTGNASTGIGLQIASPTIAGSQLLPDYRGISINGVSTNSGNTTGTIDNYQLRVGTSSAAAGSGGTLNNYAGYLSVASGDTVNTSNYGLYVTGNGGASNATNYAIYSNSTAASRLSGNLDIQSASSGNLLRVRDTTATAADVFTIADGGNATFQSQTNSTSAFLIQNAAGAQAIKVDTTADSGNLVTNGSFEVNTSGWAGRGTGSVSRITSSSFSGVGAMSVTTSAANDGAKYNLTLAVSTQYTINFMAQAVGSGFSTMNYGYSVDGSTETDCKTAQNPVTTGFKIFTCTFTTTATAPSGTPYIYIKQTDGTGRTFYIDAFQIRAGSSAGVYRETAATVSSAVTSAFGIQPTIDSSLAFNVESADGSTLVAVDSVNKRFGIGTQAPSAYLHVARTTSNDATVMARINTTSTQSGDLLQFFDDSASAVLSKFGADADLTIKPQADMSGALQVQNAAGTNVFNVDTSTSQASVRNATDTASLGSELATAMTCTGTNWTGSGGTGPWTHTSGSTSNLSCTPSITAGTTYQVVLTTSLMSTGDTIRPGVGGVNGQLIGENNTITMFITASTTGSLVFTPSSTTLGRVASVSLKAVTKSSSAFAVRDSSDVSRLELRATSSLSAVGIDALRSNSTGTGLTAMGTGALQSNFSGINNTAVGTGALQNNTTGNSNTAIGYNALTSSVFGDDNTAVGYQALRLLTTGGRNVALGQNALTDTTIGDGNAGLGYSAGRNFITGDNNIAVGLQAGYIDTDNFATVSTISGSSAIGNKAQVQASNSMVLGAIAGTQVKVGIGTTVPTNVLSVSPVFYNTGTASRSGSAVTGSGTTWTAAMVGMQFIFADGTTGTVATFTDATHITLDTSGTVSSQNYRIHVGGFQVTSAGNAYVQSTGTAAFQVQAADGTLAFSVDTTNARVYVGPTAGNTTGTILVLGNKTSFGDPTGVAGAVYYNSNTNSFRCYTASGFWQPCMQSTIPGLGIRKWGFMAPNRTGSASMNGTGYMSVPTEQSNTAAASNPQPEDRYITYDTGTTSGTEAGPIFRSGVTRETYRNRMTARIRMSADITSQRIWFGLFSTDPTGFDTSGAAKYVGLRYSTGASDTAWQCASSDGTTASVTSTGVTVTANHYYDLVIDWTSSGVLQCQVSDDGAGFSTTQKTTNIVTSDTTTLGYNLNLTNLAAANRAINISFITFESN